jgi:outer membrane cobalamin receptor
MFMRRCLLLAGSALPMAIAPVFAAGAATDDEELREVIVTARSLEVTTPLELSRYGNNVNFVSSEDIRNQGFVDLTQTLEMLVPGAYVATQSGPFSYVNLSLQGSRTSDVLWTVDGVRINNRLYNTTSPADTLPSSMVERVEVLKGGQGLLYGTQAAAGVINVVTRAFSDDFGGAVSLGGDSNEGVHANGYLRGALGGHHFVGWGSLDKSDGYQVYDVYQAGATTRDRRYEVGNFGLKYGYDFTETLRLSVQGSHTDAELDDPLYYASGRNDRDEDIISSRLDWSPSDTVQLFVKGYLHDWDSKYFEDVETADPGFYWGFRDYGLSAASRYDAGYGLEYHLGYEFQKYRGRDDYLLIADNTEKAHAVYGQVRTTDDLSSKARLAAGLRYNKTSGSNAVVWNASGVYNFTDSFHVESTLGTSFLLPDAYQLYAIDPFDTLGNPDLAPEKSFNINLAVGGRHELATLPLVWQVTGWKRSVENLIVSDDSNPPAGFDAVFINVDRKVKVAGVELLLQAGLSEALRLDASYTLSQEHVAGTSRQLANRPIHSGKLGLAFQPVGDPWGVDFALKYFGGTYSTFNLPTSSNPTLQTYGGDFIANLGAHWRPFGEHHRLGARVENLFDTDYATRVRSAPIGSSSPGNRYAYRSLGAPRTWYLNYSYDF